MYWELTGATRIENDISKFQEIKRDVRPRTLYHVISFLLYSEIILRALKAIPNIQVVGYNVNHLRYADDTALIPENEIDLQQIPTCSIVMPQS